MAKTSGGTRNRTPNKYVTIESISPAPIIETDRIPGGEYASYLHGKIYVKPGLRDAIKLLQNGEGTDEDYLQLSTVLHEMIHADADLNKSIKQIDGFRLDGLDAEHHIMEVMTEIRARVLLPSFAQQLGIRPRPNVDYRKRPIGYDYGIKRLNELCDLLGVNRSAVYNDISKANEHGKNELARILKRRSGIKETNARNILQNMFGYGVEWYDNQKTATIFYGQKSTPQRQFTYVKRGGGIGTVNIPSRDINSDKPLSASDKKRAMAEMFGNDYPNLTRPYSREIALEIIKQGKKKGDL